MICEGCMHCCAVNNGGDEFHQKKKKRKKKWWRQGLDKKKNNYAVDIEKLYNNDILYIAQQQNLQLNFKK